MKYEKAMIQKAFCRPCEFMHPFSSARADIDYTPPAVVIAYEHIDKQFIFILFFAVAQIPY